MPSLIAGPTWTGKMMAMAMSRCEGLACRRNVAVSRACKPPEARRRPSERSTVVGQASVRFGDAGPVSAVGAPEPSLADHAGWVGGGKLRRRGSNELRAPRNADSVLNLRQILCCRAREARREQGV